MTEPNPSVLPVRWATVVLAAVLGAGGTWLLFTALDVWTGVLPQLTLAAPVSAGVIAVGVGALAWWTHRAVHVRRVLLAPSRALALLALGKAALLAGALVAGAYLAIVMYSVGRLDAPLPKQRFVLGLVTAALSVATSLAGRALERSCRVPPPIDEGGTKPPEKDA